MTSSNIESAAAARALLSVTDDGTWQAGSAEPWIRELVHALIVANDAHHAIEIGGFDGYTSCAMARALAALPHRTQLTVCEIDAERASRVYKRLAHEAGDGGNLAWHVAIADSHAWIPKLPDDSVCFAWIDGNHEQAHVAREIELLWPKMRVGGIMAFHDVTGVCQLEAVVRHFGGYALDLPRLGPAGGIGLLQRRA